MAYSVNWTSKVVTIPVSDLILVSGTRYELDMFACHEELRRLEYTFNEGLAHDQILDHTNPKTDFAGVDYAGFDEIINGYTVQFEPGPTRIDLKGSNNNIIDVLIDTGISVVPNNSVGLQLVSAGSQVTEATITDHLLTYLYEGNESVLEGLRITRAALAGDVVKVGNTYHFKSKDGTTNRIVSPTNEEGERTGVTTDGT